MRASFGGAVLAAAIATAGCGSEPDRGLSARIEDAVTRDGIVVVDFAALAPGSWDRLHVFPPYTLQEQIDEQLGFPTALAGETGIDHLDSITLLVLTGNGGVISYVAHPRDRGDFSGLFRRGGWPRGEARFEVSDGRAVPPLVPLERGGT